MLGVAVSRFAGLLDSLFRPDVRTPGFVRTAYFHDPDELLGEVQDADLRFEALLGVEGPGWLLADFDQQWDRLGLREQMLDAARRIETEPSLMGMQSHMLAVGQKPEPEPLSLVRRSAGCRPADHGTPGT